MSNWAIYGKRTQVIPGIDKPDSTFRALTYSGVRVNKLSDAGTFATKEDAEEHLAKKNKNGNKPGVVFEIRKLK